MPPPDPPRTHLGKLLAGPPPVPVRKVLGVQVPPPVKPQPFDAVEGLPPKAVHPQRQPTHVGLAPPRPGSAPMPDLDATRESPPPVSAPPPVPARNPMPAQPPRSVSPSPESAHAVRVDVSGIGHVSLSKRLLRHAWLVVGPLVLSGLGAALGYVRGYAKGLSDAAERLAAIETRAKAIGSRVASAETRLDAVEGAQVAEATSNRAERATALRKLTDFAADLEQVRQGLPKIQGLAKPPK